MNTKNISDLVTMFSSAWAVLDAYDKETFPKTGVTKKSVEITADTVLKMFAQLKEVLIEKKEAGELFGVERTNGMVAGIIGDVLQSFGEKDLYPTLEEKAAHLLYFLVKNHPFVDGNKRFGAFAFIWFLEQTDILNMRTLSPETLALLTLIIAGSDPSEKDRMIGLVLMILNNK